MLNNTFGPLLIYRHPFYVYIVEPGIGVVFKVSNRNVKVIPALKEALQLSLLNKEVWCGLLRWIRRQRWLYHIWNLTGVRLVYRKLVPEPEDQPGYRKPSTFALWCLAVYFAAFGLAAQRFESRLDKVEHKSTILITQLATKHSKKALSRVAAIQNQTCPVKPHFNDPWTIYASLFSSSVLCQSVVQELQTVVEDWKTDLAGVNLSWAKLQTADLFEANLQKADLHFANLQKAVLLFANLQTTDLSGANLQKADLSGANLQEAGLGGANLQKANLIAAKLQEAYLHEANLQEADLRVANLQEADLSVANLQGATGLTFEQLLGVKTLYRAEGLPPALVAKLKQAKPALFESPWRR